MSVGHGKTFIGVSLKMYLGHEETREWAQTVVDIARTDPGVRDGRTTVVILPTFVSLEAALQIAVGTPVQVGAQNLYWQDRGAFTGEVSGKTLDELGCRYVEIGHAERRSLFGEDAETVARKVEAARRNGLVPILCVGETERGEIDQAITASLGQLGSALALLSAPIEEIVVAYEPVWAIGAQTPADPAHVRAVCRALRAAVSGDSRIGTGTVIYGGSAGPGVLADLGNDVDGVFLGRFAHDPEALRGILVEGDSREHASPDPRDESANR